MTNEEIFFDWIITDIFRKLKVEVKAKTYDEAIRTASGAYPNFKFDSGHVACKNPRFNQPDYTLLQIKCE